MRVNALCCVHSCAVFTSYRVVRAVDETGNPFPMAGQVRQRPGHEREAQLRLVAAHGYYFSVSRKLMRFCLLVALNSPA